jgi:TRAP-type C4-dicarboxylate transport system substrate-binding protein
MTIATKLTKAVLVGGLAVGLGLSAAQATELKLASFVPASHHLQKNVWEPLTKELAQATDGELKLKIYPAGQLGSGGGEQYKRVVRGVADIVHGLPGYTSSQFPESLLIELPGVPVSDVQATEGIWNAMQLVEHEYRRVKVLALFASESAILMMRDKAVRVPSDLEGLKIRVPSASIGKAVSAWGGTPVSMPITEVYNAAQTGVIDGALLGGSTLNSFKLHEVFHHYTTGVPSTTSEVFLLMNRNSYDKLSDKERVALDRLTGFPLSQKSSKSYRNQHEKGMKTIRDAGKDIIELSPEVAQQFTNLSRSVIAETVAALKREGVENAQKIVELMGQSYQGDKAAGVE